MTIPVGAPWLDCCVLAILDQGDMYGYNLTQQLRKKIDISESTLYPVLRRLQQMGCLTLYDEQYQGRNRRYYTITPGGRQQLVEYRTQWETFKEQIDGVIWGDENDG